MLTILTAYASLGLVFAVFFSVLLPKYGAAVLAPGAKGASIGFRFVLLPGAILLWPYLVMRLLRARR